MRNYSDTSIPENEGEKGVALLVTLLAVVLLTAMVLEFFYASSVDITLADNYRNKEKASFIAKGGIAAAKSLLLQDMREKGATDSLDEEWASFKTYPLGEEGESFNVSIMDEGGKLNVNSLLLEDGKDNTILVPVMKRLFLSLEVEEKVLDSILDWMDKDNDKRGAGHESAFYAGLPDPYRCANGPLDSLDELLLVAGIDREIYQVISPYLTVHSDGKVNINTAPAEVLHALLDPVAVGLVEEVLRVREAGPFLNVADIQKLPGVSVEAFQALSPLLSVKSNSFRVDSEGAFHEARERYRAYIHRGKKKILVTAIQYY